MLISKIALLWSIVMLLPDSAEADFCVDLAANYPNTYEVKGPYVLDGTYNDKPRYKSQCNNDRYIVYYSDTYKITNGYGSSITVYSKCSDNSDNLSQCPSFDNAASVTEGSCNCPTPSPTAATVSSLCVNKPSDSQNLEGPYVPDGTTNNQPRYKSQCLGDDRYIVYFNNDYKIADGYSGSITYYSQCSDNIGDLGQCNWSNSVDVVEGSCNCPTASPTAAAATTDLCVNQPSDSFNINGPYQPDGTYNNQPRYKLQCSGDDRYIVYYNDRYLVANGYGGSITLYSECTDNIGDLPECPWTNGVDVNENSCNCPTPSPTLKPNTPPPVSNGLCMSQSTGYSDQGQGPYVADGTFQGKPRYKSQCRNDRYIVYYNSAYGYILANGNDYSSISMLYAKCTNTDNIALCTWSSNGVNTFEGSCSCPVGAGVGIPISFDPISNNIDNKYNNYNNNNNNDLLLWTEMSIITSVLVTMCILGIAICVYCMWYKNGVNKIGYTKANVDEV